MTRLPQKVLLRSTLKKLAATGCSSAAAAQEALDFLAMLAGLKPVFVLGRGFDDPRWATGVLAVARDRRLSAIEGPYWDASAEGGLPGWFADRLRSTLSARTAWYICRTRATAEEVRALCGGGRPTVAQEARLLGYPECCVRDHYARGEALRTLWLDMLRRRAGGEEGEMRRLLDEGGIPEPATEDERRALEAAMAVVPCPFTSVNMCASCAGDPESSARVLSRRYEALARAVDQGLADALACRWT